ncbi:hypothetical protein AKO1_011581 [Acrasis kona]|uniref:Uncharacterized protein n=1 Tax=Acrasis kona TaxID=1008807 RepID=A0AAW2Z441_9EUKA
MISLFFNVPSRIESIIADVIMDSHQCLGDDALKISIDESRFIPDQRQEIDPNTYAIQMLTLTGTPYDIERLMEFVETELDSHVNVAFEQGDHSKLPVFQYAAIHRRRFQSKRSSINEMEHIEQDRTQNRNRRYRIYRKEEELRNLDYKMKRLGEKKLITEAMYQNYLQFPEAAKVHLSKNTHQSDDQFLQQLLHVSSIVYRQNRNDVVEEEGEDDDNEEQLQSDDDEDDDDDQ